MTNIVSGKQLEPVLRVSTSSLANWTSPIVKNRFYLTSLRTWLLVTLPVEWDKSSTLNGWMSKHPQNSSLKSSGPYMPCGALARRTSSCRISSPSMANWATQITPQPPFHPQQAIQDAAQITEGDGSTKKPLHSCFSLHSKGHSPSLAAAFHHNNSMG